MTEFLNTNFRLSSTPINILGGVAQLARAPALQAGGHRFDSVHLHKSKFL